jgi:hypothetical protein
LVICLSHKYPLNQVVPAFLKGGDLALYDLLKDSYDVQVVACAVNTEFDQENDAQREVIASLFTSFEDDVEGFQRCSAQSPAKLAKTTRTKFLIPAPVNAKSVLDYSPYIEYTGNESQLATSVYLVSGLQVRACA